MKTLSGILAGASLIFLLIGSLVMEGWVTGIGTDYLLITQKHESTGMRVVDQIEHWEGTLAPYSEEVIASDPILSSTKNSLDSALSVSWVRRERHIYDFLCGIQWFLIGIVAATIVFFITIVYYDRKTR